MSWIDDHASELAQAEHEEIDLLMQVKDLKSQLEQKDKVIGELKNILSQIAKVKYGLELSDTVEYREDYWAKQAIYYEALARKALKQLEAK